MGKKSLFKRSSSLLGLASKVAFKEAGLKISNLAKNEKMREVAKNLTRLKQAQEITKNLSQLKGAAMKAGQMLSIDSANYLPPEAMEVLSQLQSMATPERFDVIDNVLKNELKDNYTKLERLNEKALASASIGQVHQARFQNQDIVVKVQYPNILETIDSDLAILEKIIKVFMLPTQKKMDFTDTFEELSTVLKLEADYTRELEMLNRYRTYLEGDDFFYVPKSYPEVSTNKVIAMEYCNGLSINDWLALNPSRLQKDHLASKILNLFHREFLDWHLVQTDPNFGNYLIQQSPLRVVLLDFGSTLSYTPEFVLDYTKMIQLSTIEDPQEMYTKAVALGLMDSRESKEVEQAFFNLMKTAVEPALPQHQPFDFSSSDYEKRSMETVMSFTKSLKYSSPPREIIFLHRKLGGLFGLFKKLEAKIDLTPFWIRLTAYSKEILAKDTEL
jgi:aarF domain-containing kinase